MNDTNWWEQLKDPLPGRVPKPRLSGLTMIIDTGIPLSMFHDLLQMASGHVDFWKFGFGSAGVCTPEAIHAKVSLCQEYGVNAYPGGTSMEIAVAQGVWKEYLEALWDGGIRVVEVSDGTIELPSSLRRSIINRAKNMGFTVLTEVGKKRAGSWIPIREQARMIRSDLQAGAEYVIVEGRESGQNVGVYETDGTVRESDVEALVKELGTQSHRLIWEAPLLAQQTFYVQKFGNRVNLGNVRPLDIVALESIRRGLRSDTLRLSVEDGELINAASLDISGEGQSPLEEDSDNKELKDSTGPTLWMKNGRATEKNAKNHPRPDGKVGY